MAMTKNGSTENRRDDVKEETEEEEEVTFTYMIIKGLAEKVLPNFVHTVFASYKLKYQ